MSDLIENAELLMDAHACALRGECVLVICYDSARAQRVATQAAIAWKEPYANSGGWMTVGEGRIGFVGMGALRIGAVRGRRIDRWLACDDITLAPEVEMMLQGQASAAALARIAADALRERMKETDDQAFARQLREMRGEPVRLHPTPAEIAKALDAIASTGPPTPKVDPTVRAFWDPSTEVEFEAVSDAPYPAPMEKLR